MTNQRHNLSRRAATGRPAEPPATLQPGSPPESEGLTLVQAGPSQELIVQQSARLTRSIRFRLAVGPHRHLSRGSAHHRVSRTSPPALGLTPRRSMIRTDCPGVATRLPWTNSTHPVATFSGRRHNPATGREPMRRLSRQRHSEPGPAQTDRGETSSVQIFPRCDYLCACLSKFMGVTPDPSALTGLSRYGSRWWR